MSKRSEEKAREYEDSLDYYHYTSDNPSVAYKAGYEQAEKDTIERAISWVRKNAYIYTDTQNDEEGNLMIAFLEEAFIDDLKKAMEEE